MVPRWQPFRASWGPKRWVTLLLLAGAGLRLWQYLGNPALWLDELAVAHNLIARRALLLLSAPLWDAQAAPPGYLLASRAAVVAFGPNEYALRLVPLLCSLAALPIFARISMRLLRPQGVVVAVALFASSSALIIFASETKQYAVDVLAVLVLTELALRWLAGATFWRTVALTAAGVLAVWCSDPAQFVLAGLALALLWGAPEGERRTLTGPLLAWGVSSALAYAYARSRFTPGVMDMMRHFWKPGFMPWPPRTLDDATWPWRAPLAVLEDFLWVPLAPVYLLLSLGGAWALLRRLRARALLLLVPCLVTFGAAIAGLYPFRSRLVLFLVPAFYLTVAAAAEQLSHRLRPPLLKTAFLVILGAVPGVGLLRQPPVWRVDDVRPLLAELHAERRKDDRVYVYYPGWQTLRFYGARFGVPIESVDIGNCYLGDLHHYLREVDRYRGLPRLWLFLTFAIPSFGEARALVEYLDTIGVRLETLEAPPNTRPGWRDWPRPTAILYDLSDPARLARATANSRTLPAAVEPYWHCTESPVVPQVPTLQR